MNKLDEILNLLGTSNVPYTEPKLAEVDPTSVKVVEQAIIDLFLGLVGEDEYDSTAVADYKHELRTKIKALAEKETK